MSSYQLRALDAGVHFQVENNHWAHSKWVDCHIAEHLSWLSGWKNYFWRWESLAFRTPKCSSYNPFELCVGWWWWKPWVPLLVPHPMESVAMESYHSCMPNNTSLYSQCNSYSCHCGKLQSVWVILCNNITQSKWFWFGLSASGNRLYCTLPWMIRSGIHDFEVKGYTLGCWRATEGYACSKEKFCQGNQAYDSVESIANLVLSRLVYIDMWGLMAIQKLVTDIQEWNIDSWSFVCCFGTQSWDF